MYFSLRWGGGGGGSGDAEIAYSPILYEWGGGGRGTHGVRHTGMCRSNRSLF